MKILYINTLYSPHIGGGAEITLKTLAESMAARGHDVGVLATGPESRLTCDEVNGVRVWRAGVRNLYFPYGQARPPGWKRKIWHLLDVYNPLMKPFVTQVVREFKPDLVSCHNLSGWSIAVWDIFAASGIPIIQVLHDQYLLCPTGLMFKDGALCDRRCITCRLLRLPHPNYSNQVEAVVGVSRFIRDKLLAHGYFSRARIKEVIYNARNFDFDPTGFPAREDDGLVFFGFIGTLAPNKGVDLLLETFSRAALPHWRLLVAGTGKEDYEKSIKARYPDTRITFLGHTRQEIFFPGIDLLVVPSLWEDTFPGVVFESLMFGVPVLGSRRGGIPEMVVAGENGLLFEPDEPGEMAACMNKMANELNSWRSRRASIRKSGQIFRDVTAWSENWLGVYRDVTVLNP